MMAKLFTRNIEGKERLMRGIAAVILLIGGLVALGWNVLIAMVLLAAGVFVLFEALRGWCVMRACGIKTKFVTMSLE